MAIRELRASGLDYLRLATELLRRVRLADGDAGVWEAADLQWWWRLPRRSDGIEQRFFVDADGPVAAAILTEWSTHWGCDPIVVPGTVSLPELWPSAEDALQESGVENVEVLVRDDDGELQDILAAAGFAPDERAGITGLDAGERPPVAPAPEGFRLVDRSTAGEKPHPMRRRNGDAVEERLRECSLYDPSLDLAVEAPGGDVAGYALFWSDPVTEVGLVEPMRVEDEYARRGLARALLTDGLERLAARGARRLRVGYATERARRLYTGAGFRVTATLTSYRRAAGGA